MKSIKVITVAIIWVIFYVLFLILYSMKEWIKNNFEWLLVVLMGTIIALLTSIII